MLLHRQMKGQDAHLEHHDLDHGDGYCRVLSRRQDALSEQVHEFLVKPGTLAAQNRHVSLGHLECRPLHGELRHKSIYRGDKAGAQDRDAFIFARPR